MRCPKCNQKAICFKDWTRKTNAFRTKCEACGISLKANGITWFLVFVSILAFAGSFYLLEVVGITDTTFLESVPKKLKAVIAVLAVLPIVILAWFWGGYSEATKTKI